jgi:hypothetical protein
MIFFLPFSGPRELSQAPAPLLKKKGDQFAKIRMQKTRRPSDPGVLGGALIRARCDNRYCWYPSAPHPQPASSSVGDSASTTTRNGTQKSTAHSEKTLREIIMSFDARTSTSQKRATRFRSLQKMYELLARNARTLHACRCRFKNGVSQLHLIRRENRKHTFMQHVHPKTK